MQYFGLRFTFSPVSRQKLTSPEYDLVARSNLFEAVASISPPRILTWTIKAPIWRRPAIFQAADIRNISASCCFTRIGCILKIRGEDNGKILRAGQRQFRQRRPPGHRKYANPGGCRPEYARTAQAPRLHWRIAGEYRRHPDHPRTLGSRGGTPRAGAQ